MCTTLRAYTYMMGRIFLRRPRRILLGILVSLVLCVLVLERWHEPTLVGRGGAQPQERDASSGPWVDDSLGDTLLDFLPEQNNYTVRVPIPLVTREILERLHLSEPMDPTITEETNDDRDGILDQADNRYSRGKNRSGCWPPIVTSLPETRSSATSRLQVNSTTPTASTERAIDAQFCASTPCRLLVLLTIAEREPKMQEQLLQVLTLAQALGRTVVLPNVGKGRIGTCQRWDFDTYFDIPTAVRAGGGRAMLMDDFRTWVDARPRSPTMHSVVVDEGPPLDAGSAVEYSSGMQERARKNTRCFGSRFRSLDLDDVGATTIHLLPSTEQGQGPDEAALLVNILSGNGSDDTSTHAAPSLELNNASSTGTEQPPRAQGPGSSDADILLLHWDVHREVLPVSADAPIDYSPRLWAAADKVTRRIYPYLAVHWHLDKVPAAVLPACADALVDTLDILLHDHFIARDIGTVYFSSDYPLLELAADAPQKRMSYLHRQAGRILRAAFEAGGELEHWRLEAKEDTLAFTPSNSSSSSIDEDQLPLDDVGIREMLAKAISMKAALFVTNTKGCGRMRYALNSPQGLGG